MLTLNIGEDQDIIWPLTDEQTGSLVGTGTFTAALKIPAGTAVSGASSLSFAYQTSGNYTNKWLATIPGTVTATLTPGATYFLEASGSSSSRYAFRRIQCRAAYRGEA